MSNHNDRIIKTEYSEVMQKSYIDYAMSVIVARALPDVRDGLKPVQRRILFAMNEMNNNQFEEAAKHCKADLGFTFTDGYWGNDPQKPEGCKVKSGKVCRKGKSGYLW